MIPAPIPEDEAERLAVLRSYGILDTPPERRFDRITSLVATVLGAPIVLVSLVAEHHQWFKSACGLTVRQTDRDVSFCGHAILGDEPMLVPDARADPRFTDNPLVTGPPHIRTYLGAPLITPCGAKLGTLCVIWQSVVGVTPNEIAQANQFASIVMDQLEASRGDGVMALEARRRLHG